MPACLALVCCAQTGDLPDSEMVPEHNDERWLSEDTAAEHAATASGGAGDKRNKQQAAAAGQQLGDMSARELMKWAAALVNGSSSSGSGKQKGISKLPLQLAANLVLQSLGRVEFLHPGFHNDKFIFPVGFVIKRRAKTPCSGGREIWHKAEIIEAPDGSGPLFRCVVWAAVYPCVRVMCRWVSGQVGG